MRKFIVSCSICLILACSSESPTTESSLPTLLPAPIANHTDFFPSVTQPVSFSAVEGLPYVASSQTRFYGTSSLQFSEYWQPTVISGRSELYAIIIVHGGCWSNSFRVNQSYPLATALSLNGFHVWSVEYRASGDVGGGWPGTAEDVNAAIEAIISTSSDLYSQRNHLILGHSAGGHLGLLAIHQSEAIANSEVNSVGIAAITDITGFAEQSGGCNALARSFMNGTPQSIPEQYALANPDLSALEGRVFLFNGAQDGVVETTQATDSGLPFEIVEGADHFDWLHPGTPTFSRLLNYLLTNP
jgi:acetyl esterase/lipase